MSGIQVTYNRGNYQVAIDDWGTWEFDGPAEEIRFEGEDGTLRTHPCHPLLRAHYKDSWGNKANGVILFLDHCGKEVYRATCGTGDLQKATTLDREDDMDCGMARCMFEEAEDNVLLLYESGVVCFDRTAQPVWAVEGHKYDWHYLGVERGLVLYESEWEGRWAYKLDTGERSDP